ncbi:Y-family DNA polymerase [Alteromonas lipolytica]|uniref:UmuC domain-containing protein n=1 Tax=Alteromonas lipolytica TaxID=1856405 RepID=A0A1E8FIW5_9ALTE|nr:DNA polymerase Y family protein [Alteromonas lipolytica]OFI35393.1 hypothetical protein BFC17_11510 [Alteromonas lipolytica]GGF75939.1 nucleotidyltransferase [Alteromonas lipolytica]
MHWLYLYFPRLQLDQFEVLHPDCSEPVVVLDINQNNVKQRSKVAAQAGIKTGMGLAEATAIHSQIVILDYSEASEAGQIEQLANTLYTIASDIVCYPNQGIAINLTPLALYYQGLDNFFALCRQTLNTQRVHFYFGAGPTIEVARVLAHHKSNALFTEPKDALDALAKCPLHSSQLDKKTIGQLKRAGIKQLGELQALPLQEIGKRFNNEVITYLLALKGVKQPPYSLFHPRKLFSQFMELPYAVDSAMGISRYLAPLVTNNCQYLQKRNLVTDELQITLLQRDHGELYFTINAGTAHHHADDWLLLIDLKLEQLSLSSAVTSLTLTCDKLSEFNPDNLSLLQSNYSKHAENILLGKLLAKFGSQNVNTVSAINDHRPGYSNPQVSADNDNNSQSQQDIQPAWLLPHPQPLTTDTHIVYGPERIKTGWWDNQSMIRDYFIAQTRSGQRLWVFRDEHQQWFVQGYFG